MGVTASTAQWDVVIANTVGNYDYDNPFYGSIKAINGGLFFSGNPMALTINVPFLTKISSYLEILYNPLLQKIDIPLVCSMIMKLYSSKWRTFNFFFARDIAMLDNNRYWIKWKKFNCWYHFENFLVFRAFTMKKRENSVFL